MNAAEYAKKVAEEARKKKVEEERIAKSWEEYNEKRKIELQDHISKTLQDFKKLGFKVRPGYLVKGKETVAEVRVQFHRWEFQGSDESPVQNMDGYVIFWKVKGDFYPEGWTSKREDFDKRFGEAMSRWIG